LKRGPFRDIEERFGIIEQRVRAMTAENRALKKRVAELEREIEQARSEEQTCRLNDGVAAQVRERIEKVLLSLEKIGAGSADGQENNP
jgi:cell division septum initiation protein DivIVA